MHQQVRTSIKTGRTDSSGGTIDEDSLVGILTELVNTNLRSAGRIYVDGGEAFVFSVDHIDGDHAADRDARDILRDKGYEADVFEVRDFVLDHRKGALLKCIKKLERELNEPVIEVHIGAAEGNEKVPVQLVTRSMLHPVP